MDRATHERRTARRAFSIMATLALVAGLLVLSSASEALASSDPELVSAGPNGQGNNYNDSPSISGDGRLVAFTSWADLVPEDQNGTGDVYVRDRVAQTTTLVSVNQSGLAAGNNDSLHPAISSNGRWISFSSRATDLTSDGINNTAVFVRDLQGNTTELVSSLFAAGAAYGSTISGDGRFVAYSAVLSDTWNLYSTDRDTDTTVLVSHDLSGNPNTSYRDTGWASFSEDGRYLAFQSQAVLLGGPDLGTLIYLWDRMTDSIGLVSPSTPEYHFDFLPSISADGRFVVFAANGPLLPSDTNDQPDVYMRDTQTSTLEMVSLNRFGAPPATGYRDVGVISGDGKFVAFRSTLGDITSDDPGQHHQIYVRELETGATQLVSKTATGVAGNAASGQPLDLTYDGGLVAYPSGATNFLSPDTNDSYPDIFVSAVMGAVPPDPDADDDGIYDEVDTAPATPSMLFYDGTTPVPTEGEILDRAGHTITIEDAADPADGVRVTVMGTGNQKARFRICGLIVRLAPGSDIDFTCDSLIVEATAGEVEVELGEGGTNLVTVPEGGWAEITEVADDTFTVENLGTTEVSVVIDGEETTVESGDSQQVTTWDFQGFTSPVDNPDVLNVVSAGQAVPLKWRLVGTDGAPITDLASVAVRVTSLNCSEGTTADQLEEVATGSTGLHNLGDGYYQFNWKAPKAYAKSCKTLHLDAGQGVEREALFRFPK